jgi:hypothetical protein
MPKFDIFIKGISPDRMAEAETIRVNAAKALQISLSKLDELLAQPSACIRRDATEDEAKTYQRTLNKLGLVSLYSPIKRETNLELIPMEEVVETSLICPNCQHEIRIDEDSVAPEKCPECSITIANFLEIKQQNEEREAIKAKLPASQITLQIQAAKKQEEEAEKQRKLELEKEVLEELQGDGAIKKSPLNVKLWAIGGGLCVVVAGASYFLSQSPSAPPPAITSTPSLAKGAEKKSADSTVQITSSSKAAAPLDAQQAMQKTHDQAAQVLQGFGLNPDAFANAGSSGGEATMQSTAEIPTDAPVSISTNSTPASTPATTPPLNAQELFAVLNNDIAWDYFLAKNSKILLDRQLSENATKLSKFIVAHDVYVDTLGELLRAAQQAKQTKLVDDYLAALETRLAPLPLEQQAVYFAQAGGYLPLENGSNRLLARAENLLASLPKPELQLNAVLKLAVVYSKTGNIAIANSYFNKINALLTPITDTDVQVTLRAAVARAYQEINNSPVAVQWLSSTAPQLKQVKPETVSALITSYAQCNQWQSVLSVFAQVDAKEHYDLWLYQAIGASLKAGFVPNALELQKALHAPVYKALTNVMIAEYSSATANELVANATQILSEQLATDAEKAIVAGRLVSYYGKLKNTEKTEAFMTATQNALASLPVSDEKDDVIRMVAAEYAHGFQAQAAGNLLTAIQSSALKTRLNVELNQLADVNGLLK